MLKHNWLLVSGLALMFLLGCTQPVSPAPAPIPEPAPVVTPAPEPSLARSPTSAPEPSPAPKPVPISPSDTTPPSAIAGLGAVDACDGNVNLWWDKSQSNDFDHYAVYVSKEALSDVADLTSVHQINDIDSNYYQATGLELSVPFFFAVTAVDKSGNESSKVTAAKAMPTPMPEGVSDSDLVVSTYHSDRTWPGTTLLADNHKAERPRMIEVNMRGEITWEYRLPPDLKRYNNPGFEGEHLPNGNILILLPGHGVYELNRDAEIVWSYIDRKVSHDADRLPSGNTLVVFGNGDQINDAQVKEISPEGKVVWSWYARDHFNKAPYKAIADQGWTHTNAVMRLPNGNTIISPRNFDCLVEVDPQGALVRTIGEGVFDNQHDPEALSSGNILLANHGKPHRVIEFDPTTEKVVWQTRGFARELTPVRDANRLPNGNTLITATTKIVEVTPAGEVVWELKLKGLTLAGLEGAKLGFYKAERINIQPQKSD
ncbi:aryl-sulfate sulfotransferase [Bacteroidota bacterium]